MEPSTDTPIPAKKSSQAEVAMPATDFQPAPIPKVSRYLSSTALRGLNRLGDVVCPGDNKDLPLFSTTDFAFHADRMLSYMYAHDRDGLVMLLTLLAWTPKWKIRALLWLSERHQKVPDYLGGIILRTLYVGLRGMIFTLYYSKLEDRNNQGEKIHKVIKWDATINPRPEDLEGASMYLGTQSGNQRTQSASLENPSAPQIQEVFSKAREANASLRRMSVAERLHYIAPLKEIILRRQEEILDVIQRETKKSRSDALMGEIFAVLDHLQFLLGEAQKTLKDQKIKTPLALMGKSSQVFYEPMGVVLVISPWNYPFYQAIVPITTSFVTGNATIYKPSEFTPLRGLVESLLQEAGWGSDWAQVVYGEGETGKQLIDARPNKIFFTGSVATGKKIMAQAAQDLIPVELELGGKDPMIVFEDANLDRAVAGALWGAMTNTGQSCTSVERLYLQENIYETFKEKLVAKALALTQGVDQDGNTDMGLMTTPAQIALIARHLEDALAKGATLLCGKQWDRQSAAIPPLILENVTSEMLVYSEESFGPILPLFKFRDEMEAIMEANNSPYGLSASVWSADKVRAVRVARAIVTGNVSINNVMLTEGNHHLPFGGTKNSGIGRYKGVFGLQNFSNIKSVLIDGNSSKIEANWYPFTREKYQLFSKMTAGLFSTSPKGLVSFAVNGLKLEGLSGKLGKQGRK